MPTLAVVSIDHTRARDLLQSRWRAVLLHRAGCKHSCRSTSPCSLSSRPDMSMLEFQILTNLSSISSRLGGGMRGGASPAGWPRSRNERHWTLVPINLLPASRPDLPITRRDRIKTPASDDGRRGCSSHPCIHAVVCLAGAETCSEPRACGRRVAAGHSGSVLINNSGAQGRSGQPLVAQVRCLASQKDLQWSLGRLLLGRLRLCVAITSD